MLKFNQGFSLLSLVFSITVVAILASVSLSRFSHISESAKALVSVKNQFQVTDSIFTESKSQDNLDALIHEIESQKKLSLDSLGAELIIRNGQQYLQIPLVVR